MQKVSGECIDGEVGVAPALSLVPLVLRVALGDLHPLLVEGEHAAEAGGGGPWVHRIEAGAESYQPSIDDALGASDQGGDLADAEVQQAVENAKVQGREMLGADGLGELLVLLRAGRGDQPAQRRHEGRGGAGHGSDRLLRSSAHELDSPAPCHGLLVAAPQPFGLLVHDVE